jgi:septal ring factor EnvC (AmiA/AmiB activator)
MNHESRQPDDRVEGLLRQWGAEEAAHLADIAAMPAFAPRPRAPLAAFRRWAPLAAAGLLLAASAAFFVAARSGADADLGKLRAQLDQAARDLGQARADAQRLSREQNDKFQQDLARMRETFAAEKTDLQEQARRQLATLTNALSEKQTRLDETARQLQDREKQVADLKEDFDKNMKLLREFNEKFVTVGKMLDDARRETSTQEDERKTYQALYHQEAVTLARLRLAYNALAAAREEGLPPLQTTAARNRLIERCHELRRAAVSPTARELFDSLEVLLTRLELLDVKDPVQRGSFTALLATMDLTPKINSVLLNDKEDARVLAWLMETQLVLAGVERVR